MIEKKVALVTGVSSGIGQATATMLLGRGFRTFGTIRETSRAGELLPSLELVRLDVRDEESVRSCVRAVLDQAGRIDALVNNAGYALVGSLEETSIEKPKHYLKPTSLASSECAKRFSRSCGHKGSGALST